MNKSAKLRELFRKGNIVKVMGSHDALGAKLAENSGFDAVWASGLEISTSHGVPDANILTMTDFLDAAISMNEAVSVPVVADCDTGFGNSNNVIHMVKKYEAAGIAAVCIEDKHFPKVNSFIPGRQELAPISEFVGKILAAKNAQSTKDFMVIARVEALIAGWGMEEALKRANAYRDAGADAILIHSKAKDLKEIKEFISKWKNRLPLVVVPTTYYKVSAKELESIGIKMVIYANQGMRASIKAMSDTYSEIIRSGSTASIEDSIASMKEVFELQGMTKMKENELIYSDTDTDKVTAIIPSAGDHLEEYSMKEISKDIPISMIDINGKPLLQRQLEVLNRSKVYDVRVVAGYKKDKINVEGVKIVSNDLYKKTGILFSIMKALEEVNSKVFISYGDVIFDHIIFNRLSESPKDITILVDKTYEDKNYGPEKKIDFANVKANHPGSQRVLNSHSIKVVTKISRSGAAYEFPGLTFLSSKGVSIIKEIYKKNKHRLLSSGLGDILNLAIKNGYEVSAIEANSGWMEIHSLEDYKLACKLVR